MALQNHFISERRQRILAACLIAFYILEETTLNWCHCVVGTPPRRWSNHVNSTIYVKTPFYLWSTALRPLSPPHIFSPYWRYTVFISSFQQPKKRVRAMSQSDPVKQSSSNAAFPQPRWSSHNTNWLISPENGYITHPTAGSITHPSYFDPPLCPPGECRHANKCRKRRIDMAARTYLRSGKFRPGRRGGVSLRELEILWGVSRAAIHRRVAEMEGRSDLEFILHEE